MELAECGNFPEWRLDQDDATSALAPPHWWVSTVARNGAPEKEDGSEKKDHKDEEQNGYPLCLGQEGVGIVVEMKVRGDLCDTGSKDQEKENKRLDFQVFVFHAWFLL